MMNSSRLLEVLSARSLTARETCRHLGTWSRTKSCGCPVTTRTLSAWAVYVDGSRRVTCARTPRSLSISLLTWRRRANGRGNGAFPCRQAENLSTPLTEVTQSYLFAYKVYLYKLMTAACALASRVLLNSRSNNNSVR